MNQITFPDPFAPLVQFVNSMNQSMQQAQLQQQKMHQQFMRQLRSDIEDAVGMDEAIEKIVNRSESMGAEISGVLFFDPRSDEVTDVFIDSVGSLTEVDLSLVKLNPDPGAQVFSFHTHPRYGNPNFSPADMEVSRSRSWEAGHCVLTEISGDMVVNCMEL